MNVDRLRVLIGEARIGTLSRLGDGRLQFEYESDYADGADPTPLSLSMPVRVRSHPDHVVNAWLWGLLPENDAVLSRWARDFHASASSPFSLLSTPVGQDCAGAVRFHVEDAEADSATSEVAWLNEEDVADRLRQLRRDGTAWLGREFTGQFSLAGAQAKTALLFEAGRWGIPRGVAATSHILKPAIAGLDDHDLNEHLCLRAASLVGLPAVRTQILRFVDQTAVVVERYDRQRTAKGLRRIHQEDMLQALALHPTHKYQADGGPGAAEIAALFRRVMSPPEADRATWTLLDAVAWNWIIGGTDAHAKNYSVLMSGGTVRMAPLYDIASALPYTKDPFKLSLAMKLGGKYRFNQHHIDSWVKAATELRLDPDQVTARVRELASRTPDAFRDASGDDDIRALHSKLPDRLTDAVANWSSRCGMVLSHRSRST